MDWQSTPEDTVPSSVVSERTRLAMLGRPPVTGAWRDGDDPGDRHFAALDDLVLESGVVLPRPRLAYETWGELDADGGNAVLVSHALTGDSHVVGEAGPGHPTAGWWNGVVGPGLAIDTDRWFVVAPNVLGGCQGSTGPSSFGPDAVEWGSRFPHLTIRDQVAAQAALADRLGIERWAAVHPDRVERLAVLAAPAVVSADQIALNTVQYEAIRMDSAFDGGDYHDAVDGPYRGLALARRMALLNYRSPDELNARFGRSWQSDISPLGGPGRFQVESYLDFHGNKFTRRFDAGSYVTLLGAMNSHDLGRERGGVATALGRITATTLVLGVDSDRLFPVSDQREIARHLRHGLDGHDVAVVESPYGHDGFLIEDAAVGAHLRRLLG